MTRSLCLAILLLLPLAAQQTVSVSGDAEIQVVPDQVRLLLGVEVHAKQLKQARDRNDELMRAVLLAPTQYSVAPKDVQTDFLQMGMEYENDGVTPRYYWVRKTIQVTLRDITKFEALTAAMVDAGATHIHSVEFRTSDLRRYRDEARALAVKAATEKARDLAQAAGRKTGRASNINASYGGGSWYGVGWHGGYRGQMMQNVIQNAGGQGSGGEGGTVSLGRIAVTASVSMTFELE